MSRTILCSADCSVGSSAAAISPHAVRITPLRRFSMMRRRVRRPSTSSSRRSRSLATSRFRSSISRDIPSRCATMAVSEAFSSGGLPSRAPNMAAGPSAPNGDGAVNASVRPSSGLAEALVEEARVAAASGHRELARRRFESALYLMRPPAQVGEAAAIFRNIGNLYFEDGDFAAGEDCLAVATAIAEATGDRSALARSKNALAIGYWMRGRIDDAERLYGEAGREAAAIGDVKLLAMV